MLSHESPFSPSLEARTKGPFLLGRRPGYTHSLKAHLLVLSCEPPANAQAQRPECERREHPVRCSLKFDAFSDIGGPSQPGWSRARA
jgi:hypothetical protein